jgi:signal transduction histidine kinase
MFQQRVNGFTRANGRHPVLATDRLCPCDDEPSLKAGSSGQGSWHAAHDPTSRDTLETEILVPLIGDHLVERGHLADAQLREALGEQARRAADGHPILMGQLLVEMDFVSKAELERAVAQQILELHQALEQSNRKLENRVERRTHQLQKALARLDELNRLKADFVSNVSHELRTPLALVLGFVDVLATRSLGPLNEEQAQAVKSIVTAGQRLSALIEDLLLFSAAHGTAELKIGPISLDKPARAALDLSLGKASSRQISLLPSIQPQLPRVLADDEKIRWVIGQFLDNAIKFTPAGGRVGLFAGSQNDQVTVAVTDTGIGMPRERIQEAFIPFHQLDGSSTRRSGGTGNGLAIAQRILNSHGTGIDVDSRPGKGSRFAFSLPATV